MEQPPDTGIKVKFGQHPLCGLSLLTQNEVNSAENPGQEESQNLAGAS